MEPTPPNPQPQTVSRLERLVAGLEAQVLALQRQVAQEQASAKVYRQDTRALFVRLKRGDCWCEVAVGNPNATSHSEVCKTLQGMFP